MALEGCRQFSRILGSIDITPGTAHVIPVQVDREARKPSHERVREAPEGDKDDEDDTEAPDLISPLEDAEILEEE